MGVLWQVEWTCGHLLQKLWQLCRKVCALVASLVSTQRGGGEGECAEEKDEAGGQAEGNARIINKICTLSLPVQQAGNDDDDGDDKRHENQHPAAEKHQRQHQKPGRKANFNERLLLSLEFQLCKAESSGYAV